MRLSRRQARVAGGFLAGAALVALVYLVKANVEVVAHGKLLPRVSDVMRIRLFDWVSLYVDPAAAKVDSGTLNTLILVGTATVSLMTALTLRLAPSGNGDRRFFLLLGLGAGVLAADELVGIHETVAFNIARTLPGGLRPDDVLFVGYVLFGLGFLAVFRRIVLSLPGVLVYYGVAAVLAVAAAALDIASLGAAEEIAELIASVAILAGTVTLSLDRQTTALMPPGRENGAAAQADSSNGRSRPGAVSQSRR